MYWNTALPTPLKDVIMINRNMGCIEMWIKKGAVRRQDWINRNMGCIEMIANMWLKRWMERLIETWDVLKCPKQRKPWQRLRMINRNMGCIEIKEAVRANILDFRLIETWDVLKFLYFVQILIEFFWLIETWDVLKLLRQHDDCKTVWD